MISIPRRMYTHHTYKHTNTLHTNVCTMVEESDITTRSPTYIAAVGGLVINATTKIADSDKVVANAHNPKIKTSNQNRTETRTQSPQTTIHGIKSQSGLACRVHNIPSRVR